MANIKSILTENRVFQPSEATKSTVAITQDTLDKMRADADEDFEGFWKKLAREKLEWIKPFTVGLDDSKAPHYEWFNDGELNVSYNCIDRHLEDKSDKLAIIFEGDLGDVEHHTYKELHDQVCRFANTLKAQGVEKGDRVIIYMPMIPQAVIAMQACARIGATHSIVFGGFSAEALRDRIIDAGAKVVVTTNGSRRGGKSVPLKTAVDKALEAGDTQVKRVIVYKRTEDDVPMVEGRDIDWMDAEAGMSNYCEPVAVNSEHPLFLLYTSGSTGKPKGVQHSSGGYLLNAHLTNEWMFDLQKDDVFWCTADVGWITGHSYVAYGPLSVGATILMFEGVPTYPDAGRFWQVCQDHGVTVFYTAPTAIRALMKFGADLPNQYDLSKIRILGTVGEPINPEAWMWYHEVIGRGECPIIDTWWQTETGAHMIAPFPITPLKPGSCTLPLPGIDVAILDEEGNELGKGGGGLLVIKKPWPSMIRNVWNDEERYRDTYFPLKDKPYYVVGDSAYQDEDGYYWILGRVDDVLNVSGHRLGTMEIESAIVSHPLVAEAAVVGRPHDVKGEAVAAFVVLNIDIPTNLDERNALILELRNWVAKEIGPIAKPDDIRFGTNLPKTRSGKIMRRLLRIIAKGEKVTQDTSTLEDPSILEQFQDN